jgi:bacteriocin biosynthesis cyclodehydratase domain-containing protein
MRPLLRPGTHVLTRTDGSLQVGLDPAGAVVLDDSPALRNGLLGTTAAASPDLDLLAAQDLLVDECAVMPLIAGEGVCALAPVVGAALVRDAGPEAMARARARSRCRAEVVGFGHAASRGLTESLERLLGLAGVSTARRPVRSPDGSRGRRTPLGVLVGVGEPDRELADAWLRDGTPYLVVRVTEGRAVVGPFVVPGRTACLRCVDAHHSDVDSDWPLLVRQYAAASSRDRADGAPEPVDPALAAIAAGWAARDVTSYVDGLRPSTWSSTLVVPGDLTSLTSHGWSRHPECGCAVL